jgi:hypothetical protein
VEGRTVHRINMGFELAGGARPLHRSHDSRYGGEGMHLYARDAM